jgi:excinuclease UvrABC nuclease subunit
VIIIDKNQVVCDNQVMKIEDLKRQLKNTPFEKQVIKEKSFDELKDLKCTGVYILCEKDSGEIVYIGSAYSSGRWLKGRLGSHISRTKKSSFRGHLTKEFNGDIDHAIWYIRNLTLYVMEYQDLEKVLIGIAKPRYNVQHKGKEYQRKD